MWKHFINLFVQNDCYCCGVSLTSSEKCVCLGCLAQIPSTCMGNNFQTNELFYRLAGRFPLQGAYCHFYFEKKGRLQHIMQQLKYEDAPQVGLFLGELLGHQLQHTQLAKDIDVIIPVPLHKKKQINRGYNQTERIGKGLSKVIGIPQNLSLLKRIKHTSTQTTMSREARWENVKTAFQAAPEIPKRVLIIDDIVTTGATLEACVSSLLDTKHPPEKIYLASIGMARKM